MPLQRLPELTRPTMIWRARYAVMPSASQSVAQRGRWAREAALRVPVSRFLRASKTLDDAQWRHGASPAGLLLPSNRDTGSYGYHMLDSIP
jgi:hypothetical protein